MRGRRRLLAVLTGAAVAMSVLLGSGAGVADTSTVRARSNDTWRKVHTYIGKGDRVVWKNRDSEEHDVTFYRGTRFSANLPPGESVRKKFRKRGTSLYRCVLHSALLSSGCEGMCGFIHVN